ncbi:hypothetical protein Q1695_009801 [Nippostrongylus brasiliensis]|nr:hypothetical protein Q1695_009801 [Nippostrongylus brasiliensis]
MFEASWAPVSFPDDATSFLDVCYHGACIREVTSWLTTKDALHCRIEIIELLPQCSLRDSVARFLKGQQLTPHTSDVALQLMTSLLFRVRRRFLWYGLLLLVALLHLLLFVTVLNRLALLF